MTPKLGVPFVDLTAEYEIILDRARDVVSGLPPLLRGLAEPLLPEWAAGEFSHIVALLPFRVADLLDGPESRQIDETRTLAVANLLGWWSYLIQDELLDRDLDQPELLPLSTTLHITAVRLLEQLLPGHDAFWDAFQRLSLTSAETHCWEQRYYRLPLTEVRGEVEELAFLGDRSALLQLAVVAQFALHGHDQDHPLCLALAETLRHYAIARQIGDDRSDWLDDLRQGRLTYVSACIARRMRETGVIQTYADLDADQMAGFFLYDDNLFAAIQRAALDACQQAAEKVAPYDARYLVNLIDELRRHLESDYETGLESRHKVRALFSPLAG